MRQFSETTLLLTPRTLPSASSTWPEPMCGLFGRDTSQAARVGATCGGRSQLFGNAGLVRYELANVGAQNCESLSVQTGCVQRLPRLPQVPSRSVNATVLELPSGMFPMRYIGYAPMVLPSVPLVTAPKSW